MQANLKVHYQLISKIKSIKEGQQIQPNQQVQLKVKNHNHDYSIPYQVILGHKYLHQSLQNIILSMKVGQICQVKKNDNGVEEILSIEVAKLGQIKGQLLNNFKSAQQSKEKGTLFIKQKDNAAAQKLYLQAYKLVEYDSSQKGKQLKLSLLSNLALVTLNQNKFADTLKWCSQYLQQSEQANKKVIYREAMAYRGLKQWQDSKRVIKQALRKWADDQSQNDFKKLNELVSKEQKQQLAKQKAVYGKMFG